MPEEANAPVVRGKTRASARSLLARTSSSRGGGVSSSSSSTHCQAPASATSSTPQASPASDSPRPQAGKKLKWTGVLTHEQVQQLREDFGDVIVCPGYVATFGKKADAWDRIYVPGAMADYHQAKSKWLRWKREGIEDERFSWWPETMREKNIEPITGNDILNGVRTSRWQAYKKEYLRYSGQRLQRLRRKKLHDQALVAAAQDEPADAADTLLEIGGSAS